MGPDRSRLQLAAEQEDHVRDWLRWSTNRDEWDRLKHTLELSSGFQLLAIQAADPATEAILRELVSAAARALGADLAGFDLSYHQPGVPLIRAVLRCLDDAPRPRIFYFNSGTRALDDALALAELFAQLNQKREVLSQRADAPLLLALPRSAWRVLRQWAPDLWSIHHRVFRFAASFRKTQTLDLDRTEPQLERLGQRLCQLIVDLVLTDSDQAVGESTASDAIRAPAPTRHPGPQDPHFVNRAAELRQLASMLPEQRARVLVTGPGGIGKTALARAATALMLGDPERARSDRAGSAQPEPAAASRSTAAVAARLIDALADMNLGRWHLTLTAIEEAAHLAERHAPALELPANVVLGAVQAALGDVSSGLQALEAAAREPSVRPEHRPWIAFAELRIAGLHRTSGRLTEAREAAASCRRVARNIGDAALEAEALTELGLVAELEGDLGSASDLLQRAMLLVGEVRGRHHSEVADAILRYARILLALGRAKESMELCDEARELYFDTFGEQHPRVAGCLRLKARGAAQLGALRDAEELYRDALDLDSRSVGSSHILSALDLQGLGETLAEMGRPQEAATMLRRALDALDGMAREGMAREGMAGSSRPCQAGSLRGPETSPSTEVTAQAIRRRLAQLDRLDQ